MPKDKLYFWLEHQLKPYHIVINENSIHETLSGIKLQNVNVFYQNISISDIDYIQISLLGLYNNLTLKNIHINKTLDKYFSSEPFTINLKHSLFKYNRCDITINGKDLQAHGFITPQKIYINFDKITNGLKTLVSKNKDGWYYEKQFIK